TPFVTGVGLGVSHTVLYSKYRELGLHGIINHDVLKDYDGGHLAQDTGSVPRWLTDGQEDVMKGAYLVAALCATNGIIFMVIGFMYGKTGSGQLAARIAGIAQAAGDKQVDGSWKDATITVVEAIGFRESAPELRDNEIFRGFPDLVQPILMRH